MRPTLEIVANIRESTRSLAPDALLVGNVRADEIWLLAEAVHELMRAAVISEQRHGKRELRDYDRIEELTKERDDVRAFIRTSTTSEDAGKFIMSAIRLVEKWDAEKP